MARAFVKARHLRGSTDFSFPSPIREFFGGVCYHRTSTKGHSNPLEIVAYIKIPIQRERKERGFLPAINGQGFHREDSMIKKLKDICEFIDGELYGDGEIEIRGVAGIKEARQNEITFVANAKYRREMEHTQASAIIIGKDISPMLDDNPPAPLSVIQLNRPWSRASMMKSLIFFCVMGSPICTAVAGDPSCNSSEENVAPWMPSLPMRPPVMTM